MPVDPAVIQEANTTLNNGTHTAKLAFLRSVPFCPPSNYGGGAHRFAPTLKSPFGAVDTRSDKYLTKKKLTTAGDRIAFVKFKDRGDASGEPNSISFEIKYAEDLPTDAARAGYTPIWFLPWESGYMWKLKIEPVATNPTFALGAGTTPIPNPDVFFTAAINGCSVFVHGGPDAPSVYHGGAEQNEIGAIKNQLGNAFWHVIGGNAEGLWLNTVRGFDVQGGSLVPRANPGKAGTSEINKSEYVKQTLASGDPVLSPLSMSRVDPADRDKPSTLLAVQFEQSLVNDANFRHLSIEEVSPWGCVFGLRNAGNWDFYLQTNATVKYYTVHKEKRTLRKDKTYFTGFQGARYDQLGAPNQWGKGLSVNLGTRQFYPGHHAHARTDWRTFRFF